VEPWREARAQERHADVLKRSGLGKLIGGQQLGGRSRRPGWKVCGAKPMVAHAKCSRLGIRARFDDGVRFLLVGSADEAVPFSSILSQGLGHTSRPGTMRSRNVFFFSAWIAEIQKSYRGPTDSYWLGIFLLRRGSGAV